MPWLTPVGGGEPQFIPDESLPKALASGLYQTPDAGTKTTVVDPTTGLAFDTTVDRLGGVQDATGFDIESEQGRIGRERTARLEEEHGGALGNIGTFVEQGLDTATLGGFGVLSDAILGPEYTEERAERVEANPEAATVGTVVGAVAPSVLSGGTGTAATIARATPAGGAARLAESIVATGAKRGIIANTATSAAGYGVEGALFGAGHVLSETVLHDKELSAEALVAGAGEGALWGGAAGGAGSLLSRGTSAAKSKLDDVFHKNASERELLAEMKLREREAKDAAKLRDKLILQRDRALNQRGMEELRQKGRLEAVEARTGAKKDLAEYTTEQKLKLEEYRQSGKKELAEIGSESRLKIADKKLEADLAKAEAKAAVARARVEAVSERLAVEQERTARASLVMDKRLELADTYTAGWGRAAESREAVAASKLEAAALGADAKTRVGMAEALVKSGRQDAGQLVEEMIPARLRTPKAVAAARSEVATSVARLTSATDDLVRQADELMLVNPQAAADLQAMRNAAAESVPSVAQWSEKAAQGADDFKEGFQTVRQAEQAQHDLAQAMAPYLDEVGQAQLLEVTRGMDDAVQKTDDIVVDAIARRSEAGAGRAGGRVPDEGATDSAAIADLMLGAGGLPNADDIPVIGPVLGAYLKFRAARGALGKLGIKLPGPVGKIAHIGAGVQNRASEVVATLVNKAPAAAKTIERASAPAMTAAMARPLWEPAEEPQRKSDRKPTQLEQYQRRADELERVAADPEAARRKIIDSVPAPPSLANAIADAQIRKLEYLASQMPKDPRPPTLRPRPYQPNPVELQRFAEKKFAVDYPIEAIKHVLDGTMSPAAADAVKAVYPRLFQNMQSELVERIAESTVPLDWNRLVTASLVFDVPLDHMALPVYAASRQAEYAQAAQAATQPPPGGGPQIRLSKNEESGPLRRAMR